MHLRRIFCLLTLACSCLAVCSADTSMPVVTREGVVYYQYQVKDGESLYGIAKRLGWDYDLLESLNPGTSEKLHKGDILLYPTGEEVAQSMANVGTESPVSSKRTGSVTYEVPSSLSPYEAAKNLDVTTEQLYAQNPWARRGLRKGDKIVIDYDKLDDVQTASGIVGDETSEKVEATVADRFSRAGKDTTEAKNETTSVSASKVSMSSVPDVVKENEEARQGVSSRNPLIGLDRNMLMEYTIQPGEDVAEVASNFNTTVRDIYFLNKGLSEAWFPEGCVIDLLPGSKDLDHRTVTLKSRVKQGESTYKIKNGDTWESVAEDNGLTVAELREANRNLKEFKKGKKLIVPRIVTHSELQDVVFSDPRSGYSEGRRQIHSEVADYGKPERNSDNLFDIVVLTSRSSADLKRDREFLRGFLLGVNEADSKGKKFGVQVIDITDRRLASVYISEAKSNRPDLIVATFEKDFPEDLVDYASSHGAGLVNVFDAKSSSVNTDASVFQVLQSSEKMNDKIAEVLLKKFHSRQFIFIDDNSNESDNYSQILKNILKEKGINFKTFTSAGEISSLEPSARQGYVIMSNANSQSAISSTLQSVESLREAYPDLSVSVVGRPTWIVYAEKMKQMMMECDTYIPSRFFYDVNALASERFRKLFSEYYNVVPTASFPPYAAMGYDVARYFISSMISNDGDFNRKVKTPEGVEISFDFNRQSAHSGMVNTTLYLMHYSKSGVEGIKF